MRKSIPASSGQLDLFAAPPADAGADAGAHGSAKDRADPSPAAGPVDPPVASAVAPAVDLPADLRSAVLQAIADWAERGWLRRLDSALAGFVAEAAPASGGPVLLATALVAHLEGQGHTCLVLDDLVGSPRALRWSGDAADALGALLARLPDSVGGWIAALSGSEVVHVDAGAQALDGAAAGGGTPLVLSAGRLYLRRYWRYERRVAADVGRRTAVADPVDERAARTWLDRLFVARNGSIGSAASAASAASEADTGSDPSTAGPDWQKIACAIALSGRLTIVTGGPGTGKTYTAARLLALLYATAPDPARLRVALAAPTGKAAARLRQSIDGALATLQTQLGDTLAPDALVALATRMGSARGPARTLHGLLGTRPGTRRFRHDASNPLDVDVVIVDEASMVHVEMMDALLAALPPSARVLLLGDKDQLSSVEAGAVLGELCRDAEDGRYRADTARFVAAVAGESLPAAALADDGPPLAQHTVMLRHSQRFSTAIAGLAAAVNAGDADRAAALLGARDDGAVAWTVSATPDTAVALAVEGRAGCPGGFRTYLDTMQRGPAGPSRDDLTTWIRAVLDAFDTFRVLCAVREGEWGVAGLNRAIAERLGALRLLAARGEWYEGRPVLVTRNDTALGVFNGDVGIALRLGPGDAGLRACFADGDGIRSIGVGRLGAVETAFAMTVHKSQGSEFDHTVLVLPPETNPVTTRELVYTGVTRARSAFTLVSNGTDVFRDALAQTTQRSSGLLGFIGAVSTEPAP